VKNRSKREGKAVLALMATPPGVAWTRGGSWPAPGVRIEVASLWEDVCEDGASPILGLHARWGSAGKEPAGRL
jgi:hypothetical protein